MYVLVAGITSVVDVLFDPADIREETAEHEPCSWSSPGKCSCRLQNASAIALSFSTLYTKQALNL